MRFRFRLIFVLKLCCLFLLTACAGKVKVSNQFPAPVIEPLKLKVGVFYPPELTQYIYDDKDSGIKFSLGRQQQTLFEQVFSTLFVDVMALSSLSAEAETDFIIEPKLNQFAFLTPKEMDTKFYVVTIKYDVNFYTATGRLVFTWPVIAYGRNRTQMLYPREALGEAVSTALRDVAARVVSQLPGVIQKQQSRLASDEAL